MGWLDKLKKKKSDVRGEIERQAYQEQQLKEAEKMGRWRAQQEGKQRRKAPTQGDDRFGRVFGGFQRMAETGGRVNQFMLGGSAPKKTPRRRRRKPKYVWVKVRR